MDTNVRLEEILEKLRPGEFVGKNENGYTDGPVWVLGELDNRGVLQGKLAGKTLFELGGQIERLREEEDIAESRLEEARVAQHSGAFEVIID